LDVRAVLKNGDIVLIEMQLARVAAFEKRVTYNLCKSYANQLESGEDYLISIKFKPAQDENLPPQT